MPGRADVWTDEQVDRRLGRLLQVGVIAAALVILAGGVVYLMRHSSETAGRHTFQGEPADLRHPAGIVRDAIGGQARGIIAVGLLLLVATPIARVAFAGYAFVRQRDWFYVAVAGFVLAVLLVSLLQSE